MDFQEVGCEGMDWIGLVQGGGIWGEDVNAVRNGHSGYIRCGEFLDWLRTG